MSNIADEDLNVTKVYEILKSGNFQRDLYWDVLSIIKDKPSFKLMRETAEKLIKKKTDVLETLSDSKSDNENRKTIVAEICSMSYAIDTVFSKILFLKLENACKAEVRGILKELQKEGKISDDILSKMQTSSNSDIENAEKNISAAKSSPRKETPAPASMHMTRTRKIVVKKDDDVLRIENPKDNTLKSNKRDQLPTASVESKTQVVKQTASESPKKDLPIDNINANAKIAEVTKTDVLNALLSKNQEAKSDADSDISVGNISIPSVSSVHTSDLSSFDDEISMSSEDENGSKKRLSLKDIQKNLKNGTSKKGKKSNGPKLKKSNKSTKILSVEDTFIAPLISSTPQTKLSQSSTSTADLDTSTKRIRKPNSKYSSDELVCQSVKVKERKKQTAVFTKNASEKNSSNDNSPKRKRNESSEEDAPNKIQKLDIIKEKDTDNNNVPKQSKSSDVFQPNYSVRSLTSRKTAPVTLYSTP